LVMAAMGFAILGIYLPLTIYMQSVLGLSAIDAGITLAIQPVAMFFSSGVASSLVQRVDRKSTRLNSSHVSISYAVFCLKKINLPTPNEAIPGTCPNGRHSFANPAHDEGASDQHALRSRRTEHRRYGTRP